jgi:hypothetical protein
MNKRTILGLLGLAFFVSLGVADDLVPVAVSPGAENGPAVVRQSCPTFSWTAVSWALTYKVVVFEATDGEAPTYEKIAAKASPVLIKEIPGKAFSWTPSADEALLNGGSYVWYVGAMVNAAQGSWSEGRKFIIAESPAWGVVSEPREDGIGAGDSRQILRDKGLKLTAAAKENFNLADDPMSQGLIDIEGTEGTSNTFYGSLAGNTTMTGTNNSFFGRAAGLANTTGNNNTFAGYLAGRYNTASNNTFMGYYAGAKTTTGSSNTFIGKEAGRYNTTGYENAFLGDFSGYSNNGGAHDVFVGREAGYSNTSGSYNTFVGDAAGNFHKTGDENTFIGDFAGLNNIYGADNVFIGNEAGLNETGSNKLCIQNQADINPLIYGEFDNAILNFNGKVRISAAATMTAPTHLLDVGTSGAYCNGTTWHDGSSREYKENVEELTTAEAIRALEKLEPVKFNYKANKDEMCLGFIAEDVPDLVAVNDRKSLVPMDMVAMLTKVVQEQQKALLEQQKVAQEQQKSITDLQKKITKLEKQSRKEK